MFEDSLVESTRHISKRRGWMTLLSTGIQIALVAVLVILPLLRTSAISPQRNVTPVVPPYVRESRATQSHPDTSASDSRTFLVHVVQSSGSRSLRQSETAEHFDAPAIPCQLDCESLIGIPHGFDDKKQWHVVLRKSDERRPVISRLDPGQIVQRVEPLYPHLAVVTRTQGLVVLHALISREGTIEQLQALSGHPLLVPAAINAVRQWRFRPYILNGQPIEVETEITVNFTLDGPR